VQAHEGNRLRLLQLALARCKPAVQPLSAPERQGQSDDNAPASGAEAAGAESAADCLSAMLEPEPEPAPEPDLGRLALDAVRGVVACSGGAALSARSLAEHARTRTVLALDAAPDAGLPPAAGLGAAALSLATLAARSSLLRPTSCAAHARGMNEAGAATHAQAATRSPRPAAP
jgi:hypothetical protein